MTNLLTTAHLTGELLHNRYKVTYPLGRGGIGITYAAQDLQTGQAVALKVLSLRREADWKKLELFEREAKVLAQLNHPAIPSYIDYFQIETERDYSFCIVQQLAPGQSLEQWIDEDWQPSLEEIEQFSIQLLEILIYLQTLLPPVIHRDIKPQNVIRQQNGQIFLVDFGSVQDTFRQNVTRGSTVVGTFGYMAPEQFRGQAVPSTDLYGLGTTLLFLLIGDSPADLPQRKLKIDFRAALPFKDTFFADWLERLLEPRPEHRFVDAQAALNVLKRTQPLPLLPTPNIKPLSCPIQVERTADTLSIKIPGVGLRTPQMQRFAIANLLWNGFLTFVLFMMVSLQLFLAQGKLMGFGLIVAIGLILLVKCIYGMLSVTYLELDRQSNTLRMDRWLLGSRYKAVQDELRHMEHVQFKFKKLWPWRKVPFTYCRLILELQSCEFGGFLAVQETAWLTQEINNFVQR